MDIKNTRPDIFVVDNFFHHPSLIRGDAIERGMFEHHPEAHKGMRAPATPVNLEMREFFERVLGKKFVDGYCCYQLCVAGEQLVYHSDTQGYAAVVYLTPDAPVASGTSFYKSKATGLRSAPTRLDVESVTEMESELRGLERDTYEGKLLDRTAWEEVDRVGNVYNRCVVWNARLIHAATDYFGTDIKSGRLFLMFFFDAE